MEPHQTSLLSCIHNYFMKSDLITLITSFMANLTTDSHDKHDAYTHHHDYFMEHWQPWQVMARKPHIHTESQQIGHDLFSLYAV